MATALRPRKPRPPGASSSGRSSRLPSAALPQPSSSQNTPASEPATAREQPPLPPASQPAAEPPKADSKSGAEAKPSQAKSAASEARSPAGQSPAGGMQNPFAAQAQKPMAKPSDGPSRDSTPLETEDSNIGDPLASAQQPKTLLDPFKEAGKKTSDSPKAPSAEGSQAPDTLSFGSTVEPESVASSSKISEITAQSPASRAAAEGEGSETDKPKHKPAVSAFTAVASQPGS